MRFKKYQLRKWSEDCWARIALGSGSITFSENQGMQEGHTAQEEMRQQQRMKVMKDMTPKIGTNGCEPQLVVRLVVLCKKACSHPGF